jgi:DNA-binding response OmpR family regulator
MRSARILVVADEVNARTSVVESLRADGHDIEVASDANEALGRRDTFSPHVVVVDFDMRDEPNVSTVSITWITPFVTSTSALITVAPR